VSAKTSIAWSDATWNPTVGCSRVSAGCEHCYAERQAHRFHGIEGHALADLTESGKHGPRWNGTVRLNPNALELPLRWKKPRRIFVNSMSDLFHEQLSDEQIDQVFAVMALRPQHTYLVLTKRPERMRAYMTGDRSDIIDLVFDAVGVERGDIAARVAVENLESSWPLSNVWLGVSVEDQKTADERIPLLLETPAALSFVSYEPGLGPVDFTRIDGAALGADYKGLTIDALHGGGTECDPKTPWGIKWVICGGESGPHARPFDVAWARSVIKQCRAAQIPAFLKQLGAKPVFFSDEWAGFESRDTRRVDLKPLKLRSRKGDDPSEWPEDLRVQEFPS